MSDPAFAGNCLSCGNPTYGQAECDACSNWDGLYPCPECQNDIPHEECRNDEQPKRCLDHMDKDELYTEAKELTECRDRLIEEVRSLKARIEELESQVRYRDGLIQELELENKILKDSHKRTLENLKEIAGLQEAIKNLS